MMRWQIFVQISPKTSTYEWEEREGEGKNLFKRKCIYSSVNTTKNINDGERESFGSYFFFQAHEKTFFSVEILL